MVWEGVVVLKEPFFNSVLLIFNIFYKVCGGLERTDFSQFLLWEGVVVMKGVDGLERTDF